MELEFVGAPRSSDRGVFTFVAASRRYPDGIESGLQPSGLWLDVNAGVLPWAGIGRAFSAITEASSDEADFR
jgi:hypothetical protein